MSIAQPALGKFNKSVSMVSWGYNEEESVEEFLLRALDTLAEVTDDYELVFVNDGSADRTGVIADAVAAKNPHLRVIHNPINVNVGISSRRAIAAATKEIIFWQTVDWSYDISNLRIFLELTRYYDVVQGVRPVPIRPLSYIPVLRSINRVKSRSDNFIKAIISLSNYYLVRILFRTPFHDFQNVTFYPRQLAQSLQLEGVTSFVNPEMLIRSYAEGARFIEVPIPFIKRVVGEAKGTRPLVVLRSAIDVAKNFLKWGIALRFAGKLTPEKGRIHRLYMPFELDEAVLQLCIPVFKSFRDPNAPLAGVRMSRFAQPEGGASMLGAEQGSEMGSSFDKVS